MLLDQARPPGATRIEAAPTDRPEAGVIEEARRRQRRHRVAGAATVLAGALVVGLLLARFHEGGQRHPPPPPLRLSSSLRWLTGPPLSGRTGLRLVVSDNAGPASLVDPDSGSVRDLPALDVPREQSTGVVPLQLLAVPGGALAVVTHKPCAHCAITEDDVMISASGAARRITQRLFPALYGTVETDRVPGTDAEWVLTWPHHGPCTLRLVPSMRAAVTVPCGDLGPAFPSGIALWTDGDTRGILVDPLTGAVRGRLNTTYSYDLVAHGLAIEGAPYGAPTSLSLVDLDTGTRKRLGWPSILHFGYEVFPQPAGGPLVAIEFGDPAYPPPPHDTTAQAADIWILDTRTGRLTHLPGFPILEWLKLSGIAWTADGRLVVVARGGGRTVFGLWIPGQQTLPVRAVPALDGYSGFVALDRP